MPQSSSTSSNPTPPITRTVAFDVKPVMQRYSSSSSISKTSQVDMIASETIRSKSRCATFFYNVPRSSIMLTLPSFIFLITGACLVATKDSSKDWFDDGVLLVAFVFLVVGGIWFVAAVVYWTTVWCRNKPALLPRNLNKLPQYNQMNSPNIPLPSPNINTNNNNSNDINKDNSFDRQKHTNQSRDSSLLSPSSDLLSPTHSDVFFSSHSPQPNQDSTHRITDAVMVGGKVPSETTQNVITEYNEATTVEKNEEIDAMKRNTVGDTEEINIILPVKGSIDNTLTQDHRERTNSAQENTSIEENNISDTAQQIHSTEPTNTAQPVSNTDSQYRNNMEVF